MNFLASRGRCEPDRLILVKRTFETLAETSRPIGFPAIILELSEYKAICIKKSGNAEYFVSCLIKSDKGLFYFS